MKTTYDTFFAALSGNHRLAVIQHLLANGPQNVTEVASSTGIEQSLVSRSLGQLLSCGFVHIEVRGKHHYYSLNENTIVPLFTLIDRHIARFCSGTCSDCTATGSRVKEESANVR